MRRRLLVEPLEERTVPTITASLQGATLTISVSAGDSTQYDVYFNNEDPQPAGQTVVNYGLTGDAGNFGNFDNSSFTSIRISMGSGGGRIFLGLSEPLVVPANGITIDGGVGGANLTTCQLWGPLTFATTVNTWRITGPGSGSINGNITFQNVTDLGSQGDGFNPNVTTGNPFQFEPGGSLRGFLDFPTTLDFSAYDAPVSLDVDTRACSAVHGGVYDLGHTIIGSSSTANTLTGSGTWSLTGRDQGSLADPAFGQRPPFTFSGFANLVGAHAVNPLTNRKIDSSFLFADGAALDGSLHAGPGNDTVHLGKSGTVVGGIHGDDGTDTLIGPDTATTWQLTGADTGTVGSVPFDGIENLTGGSGDDHFNLGSGGSLSRKIDGGGGSNTLGYAGTRTPVTIQLASSAATNLNGGTGHAFAHITHFTGGKSLDNLVGPHGNTVWQITGSNAGTLAGDTFTFAGFANLTGSYGADTFVFSNGAHVSGRIDGGVGNNWLDFSGYTTGIQVDLAAGSASPVFHGGPGGVAHFLGVLGGSGDDTLSGGGYNILVGGPGNDTIGAAHGRNVVIGGTGSDTITGGTGDDLLIAGRTRFDGNETALLAILTEWKRKDLSYSQRVADLRAGVGAGHAWKLVRGRTVFNDTGHSILRGDPVGAQTTELDWFFANLTPGHDTIVDRKSGELVN